MPVGCAWPVRLSKLLSTARHKASNKHFCRRKITVKIISKILRAEVILPIGSGDNMTHEELWQQFADAHRISHQNYLAFQFGGNDEMADLLGNLVFDGQKTATASAFDLYALAGEPLPQVGSYGVVLDSKDRALCVIRNTKVDTLPFKQVPSDHAFKEGEGDRSLASWRKAHQRFFVEELAGTGIAFSQDLLVVCEEFEVVWRARIDTKQTGQARESGAGPVF